MKPKIFTAILLFFSAYSPLFVILAVKDFDFNNNHFKHLLPIATMLIISTISIIALFLSIKKINRGSMAVEIKSVNSRSVDLINYTIPYIVSFFGFDLSKTEDVISLTIFLMLMLLMTIKSKSIFMNPLLLFAGYNLYDIEYSFDGSNNSVIAISKDNLKKGQIYYIRSLTRFIYITTERKINNHE